VEQSDLPKVTPLPPSGLDLSTPWPRDQCPTNWATVTSLGPIDGNDVDSTRHNIICPLGIIYSELLTFSEQQRLYICNFKIQNIRFTLLGPSFFENLDYEPVTGQT
jgi:hypothetical protein